MPECPRCSLHHKVRDMTVNGDKFTCPKGHEWVDQDQPVDDVKSTEELQSEAFQLASEMEGEDDE